MSHCASFRFVGATLLFVLSACNSHVETDAEMEEPPPAPVGLYEASCEGDEGTIAFQSAGVAVVKYGDCHEYRVETWEYRVDADTVTVAPQGRFDDPGAVVLRIVGPDELERDSSNGFGVCGNCETYLKQ